MASRQPPLSQELRDREWIHYLWVTHQECFTALDPNSEQRAIHDYYKAHRREWAPDQAKAHIAACPECLAESAHKALLLLKGVVRWCRQTQGLGKAHYRVPSRASAVVRYQPNGRPVTVTALANPEPDVADFVRALIELVRGEAAHESPPPVTFLVPRIAGFLVARLGMTDCPCR